MGFQLHPISSNFIQFHPITSNYIQFHLHSLTFINFQFGMVCQGHIEQIGTIKPISGGWTGSLNGLTIRAPNGAKNEGREQFMQKKKKEKKIDCVFMCPLFDEIH